MREREIGHMVLFRTYSVVHSQMHGIVNKVEGFCIRIDVENCTVLSFCCFVKLDLTLDKCSRAGLSVMKRFD